MLNLLLRTLWWIPLVAWTFKYGVQHLIAAEVNALQSIIVTDGSSIPSCFQLNHLLVEILLAVQWTLLHHAYFVSEQRHNRCFFKEFYRVVKEATNLVRYVLQSRVMAYGYLLRG
jgi:hypothetical protein